MKKILRFIAIVLAVIVVFVTPIFAAAWYRSNQALQREYALADVSIIAADTPEAIARGAHLARTRGCTGCHGDSFGGRVFTQQQNRGISAHQMEKAKDDE